ncbi:MAG: COX15/CtaA family protein [Verrucomicrobiae bacterium]|nr:COX15/CtaA family protein [Verrucomicrobiae bacterium]MCP5521239.1 COX15/CtaA family protein [Verrucomicrobiales bacterium]
MTRSPHNPALTAYAWLTALATLILICFGGLVTSHGAGLAVPDWPNSYGYNMFAFPLSQWLFVDNEFAGNGIFYEHSHRLVASGVGLMTVLLAVWLWFKEPRRWMRVLGICAVLAVIAQGVLGGLRVTLLSNTLGWIHGAVAQSFLCLVVTIALCRTRRWQDLATRPAGEGRAVKVALVTSISLIFLQLVLGAAMRHRHAGLAVPDFPLAYGEWWPATDATAITRYNRLRLEERAANDLEALDIHLHMAHRLNALLVLAAVTTTVTLILRREPGKGPRRGASIWLALVFVQAGLGIWTVWSNKAADIATAHVAVGSTVLALGVALALIAFRRYAPGRIDMSADVSAGAARPSGPLPA